MTWRPRRFRLGAMREVIDIRVATTTTTNGEPNRVWVNSVASEPAAVEYVSGGETLRGRQVEASVDAVFTIHWRIGLTTEMQIVHSIQDGAITETRTYGIVKIEEVEGGRRYLEIQCKRTGNAPLVIAD